MPSRPAVVGMVSSARQAMLLQFSVENFLSFREPQVLSMLAAEGIDHPPHMAMEGRRGRRS